jgi:ABC-type phosphate transport system permease subunit
MSAMTRLIMGSAVVSRPTAKPVMMLVALPVSLAAAIFMTGLRSRPV